MLHQVGTASAPHNRPALNIFQPVTGCESAEQVTGVEKTEIISTEQEKHCCWEERGKVPPTTFTCHKYEETKQQSHQNVCKIIYINNLHKRGSSSLVV